MNKPAPSCATCGASLDESDTGLWEDADAPPSADLDSRRYCDESADHLHDPEFDFEDEPTAADRIALVRLDIARIGDDRERSHVEAVLAAWLESRNLPSWDSMTPPMQAAAFQLAKIRPYTTERP
jgi:hypothetical protein